ncbi:MAG: hypothetical protein AAGG48_09195 [Planctomycetota bacterium]
MSHVQPSALEMASNPLVSIKPIDRALASHRIVQTGLLLTLVWKWTFFVASNQVYHNIPLRDSFFPVWLQSAWTAQLIYLAAVTAVGVSLVTKRNGVRRVCAAAALMCTTILCIHQASYNDMTFVTAWWTCLWTLWFVFHIDDVDQSRVLRRASFLSRSIISVILLGGASGKWTAEYWSGEVFYDIYFVDRDYWVFNLLRENFETEQLRSISMWYSRKVVLVETIAGLGLWALPPRIAAATAIVLLASIALLSNFLLFSVLFALIGLAAVGLFVPRSTEGAV